MKRSLQICLGLALWAFCLVTGALAESHYRYAFSPDTEIYFGHISYIDVSKSGKATLILREGKTTPETAVINFPIAPGDTIITSEDARCEILFDTGTLVRLDRDTEVKIETVLAQSLTSPFKLTNLVIDKGQVYMMYKQYKPLEVFQLMSPNASVKLKHNTRMMMRRNVDGSTDVQVTGGQASVLFGQNEQALGQYTVNKSKAVAVTASHILVFREYNNSAEFYLWNEDINRNYVPLHEGLTAIPKPVQRLSPAVFHFAQMYSSTFGEWIWNDIYGYVWRPFYNDYYPSGTWQPYYYGQWRDINDNLFWVPRESWGWVPYHLGSWIWNKRLGWVWLPGSVFAPAWVSWNFYFGHFAWRPLGLYDWYFSGSSSYYYCWMPEYLRTDGLTLGKVPPDEYDFDDEMSLDLPSQQGAANEKSGEKKILDKNQLKQKETPPVAAPKDIKKVLVRLAEAILDGDEDVLGSLNEMPGTVVIRAGDLNRTQVSAYAEPLGNLDKDTREGLYVYNRQEDPKRLALTTFRQNEIPSLLGKNLAVSETISGDAPASDERTSTLSARTPGRDTESTGQWERLERSISAEPSSRPADVVKTAVRFRDWNPDIREAVRLGVTIDYSSEDNTIRCPDLGLSSGSGNAGTGSLSQRVFSQARSSFSGRRGGSLASSSGRSSSQSSTSSRSGSSSDRSESRTSSTGKTIKK